ncbi:MAG: hypothetical protein U0414_16465 [Polyangiaceae bacterium]
MNDRARRSVGRRAFLGGAAVGVWGVGRSLFAAPGTGEIELDAQAPRRTLMEGRSAVRVTLPANAFVTLAVLGPRDALLGFDAVGCAAAEIARRSAPAEEDGMLPHVVGFAPRPAAETMLVSIEAKAPVEIAMTSATTEDAMAPSPKGLKSGEEKPRPLVVIPAPASRDDGYFLEVPARYTFARIDVAIALLGAYKKVWQYYRQDPVAVHEISQWNGTRPRTDAGNPRHISHVGGVDADIAFPANDGVDSTYRDHCTRAAIDREHANCAPGTVRGIDVERTAFFLGALVDAAPSLVTKVFMDEAFRAEVIRVAPDLARRSFIGEAALGSLSEDGVIVASPWHTDHFHVRFGGEQGRAPLVRDEDSPVVEGGAGVGRQRE